MLQELINHITYNLKNHRGVLRLISTRQFEELFNTASEESKTNIIEFIKENNKQGIQLWIKSETGEKNLTELRLLGKRYSIKNYGRISKRELIKELSKYA